MTTLNYSPRKQYPTEESWLRWDSRLGVKVNFDRLAPQLQEVNRLIATIHPDYWEEVDEPIRVDEVALSFESTYSDTFEFIRRAVKEPGIAYFNAASDMVHTMPIPSLYHVLYDFLSVVGAPRLELMRLIGGVSPLHSTIEPGNRIVHFSFKCYDVKEYEEVCRSLMEKKANQVQACESEYGLFSYWLVHGIGVYIKPRVNLRDTWPTEEQL